MRKKLVRYYCADQVYPFSVWWQIGWWLTKTECTIDFGYSRCDAKAIVYFKRYRGKIWITKQVVDR